METAHNLHVQAEKSREEGNFEEALKFADLAMLEYQKEGNYAGFAEVLSARFLTLRQLFEQIEDSSFAILAKHTQEASIEIAKKSGDKKALAIPLHNLGKVYEDLEDWTKAAEIQKEAIANLIKNPPSQHNKASVMQEMIIHMSFAEYMSGDKTALERLEKAIENLAATNEDKYEKDVWMSGGYMHIAKMLKDDDPDKSALALDRAREIIDANPDLKLRKKQLEKLSAKLK